MEPSPGAAGQRAAALTLSAARGSGECGSGREALLDKAWAGSSGCHGGLWGWAQGAGATSGRAGASCSGAAGMWPELSLELPLPSIARALHVLPH